jgi:hypothetical protein
MKRITKVSDIHGIDNQLSEYIKSKIEKLTADYCVESIDEFGAIFIAESTEDLNSYQDMGFVEPINRHIPEYIAIAGEKDGISGKIFLECCFVLSDGYGVIVICEKSIFTKTFKDDRHLMSILPIYNDDNEIAAEKR